MRRVTNKRGIMMGRSAIRLLLFTIYFLLFTSFLTSCYSTAPVLKVALVGPFEGAERAIGYDVIYSARLAVREVNAQGGIGGHRVALVALDDGGDPQLARETAVSIINDPAIVAVVGHWQAETTAVSVPLYEEAGLLFVPMGDGSQFDIVDPAELPQDFQQAYADVTPFDEVAGEYAGSAYDAFTMLWAGMETAVNLNGTISRESVKTAVSGTTYTGLTGQVYDVP